MHIMDCEALIDSYPEIADLARMAMERERECSVPKLIFVVPYRNRPQQKFFFCKYMSFILEDKNPEDYEIYFSHQCDARTFNRGAMKNIGFMAAREKYPNDYKDITFVFNDVDTIPFNKIFNYETTPGVAKHFYGYNYALGGIVAMRGSDFERINGFPAFWGWGMEDNVLQKRCDHFGIKVDRSVFYKIGSPEMLQLFDGITRIISKKDPWRGEHDNGVDGVRTIHNLSYTIDDKSDNPTDNVFVVHNPRIKILNVHTFLTHIPFGAEEYYNYDLREPKRKIIHPDKIRATNKTVVNTADWSNIPHYPTSREKRKMVAQYLTQMGKPIPPGFMEQLRLDEQNEVLEDSYNANLLKDSPSVGSLGPWAKQSLGAGVQGQVPSKFSREYANYIGVKPRATASARIGLGGAY